MKYAQDTLNMRNERFGMFVHWGLYSILAGKWDGKEVDGLGE